MCTLSNLMSLEMTNNFFVAKSQWKILPVAAHVAQKYPSRVWWHASVHSSWPQDQQPLQTVGSMECKDTLPPRTRRLRAGHRQKCRVLFSSLAWGLSCRVDTHNTTCSWAHTPTARMNNKAFVANYSWSVQVEIATTQKWFAPSWS